MGDLPLYQKIYLDIKEKIEKQYYKVGERLPYEKDLMKEYDVSRDTIRRAYTELKDIGYIYSVKGNGTFIKNRSETEYSLSKMLSFSEIISSEGKKSSSVVISAKEVSLSSSLNDFFKEEDNVYKIKRIRLADNLPMCYEVTYISKKLCPDIIEYITPNVSTYSLYETMYQLDLGEGDFKFKAVKTDKEKSQILDLKQDDALLKMEAYIRTTEEVPLYMVEAYYVGEKYTFQTKLRR